MKENKQTTAKNSQLDSSNVSQQAASGPSPKNSQEELLKNDPMPQDLACVLQDRVHPEPRAESTRLILQAARERNPQQTAPVQVATVCEPDSHRSIPWAWLSVAACLFAVLCARVLLTSTSQELAPINNSPADLIAVVVVEPPSNDASPIDLQKSAALIEETSFSQIDTEMIAVRNGIKSFGNITSFNSEISSQRFDRRLARARSLSKSLQSETWSSVSTKSRPKRTSPEIKPHSNSEPGSARKITQEA